jgi:protein-disulfide isomerase
MKRFWLVTIVATLLCTSVTVGQTRRAGRKSQPKGETYQLTPPITLPQPGAQTEDCGCDGKTLPDTIAVVNGVQISSKEIDELLKDRIQELQRQIVDARKRELDLQINTRLLDAEAKRRGISTVRLIELEITSKVVQPTEADAKAFYDLNKSRIEGEFKDSRAEIIRYLLDHRRGELSSALAKRLRAQAKVAILVAGDKVTPPATPADRARLLATVNGARLTSGDIETSLLPAIANTQDQIYELRKLQLDMKINDILLEQEARKRTTTPAELMQAEVGSKIKEITDADAQKFYQENKERISGDFEQVKGQIIQYLRQQEQQRVEKTFADGLRKDAMIQMLLPPPESAVLSIAVDNQPFKGPATAPVTIVEFTDFQCPSCAMTQPLLEEIVNEYTGKVRLVVRDFPLDQHAHAVKAAEAAEAAREQGKYWEYTALIFKNQSALEVDKLKEYATHVGLDRKKFDAALDSGKYNDQVQQDLQEGYKLGVNSTPTVFINGRKIKERTRESLKSAVEAALKASK